MPEEQPDLFDRLLELLAALIMPVWGDLIVLIPVVLMALVAIFLVFTAWQWRRADARNRPRLVPRVAGTPPPDVHVSAPSRWPFVVPFGLTLIFFALALPPKDASGNVVAPINVPLLAVGLLISLVSVVGWLRDAMREWRHTALAGEAVAVGGGIHGLPAGGPVHALPAATFTGAPVPASRALVPVTPEPPPGVHMPGPSPWPFFAPIGMTLVFFGLIFSPILIVGGIFLGIVAAAGWLRDAFREWRSTDEVGHAVPTTRDPVEAWPRRLVPLFSGVIVLCLAVLALPVVGGWLAGLRPGEASPTPIVVPTRPEIAAPPGAATLGFDRSVLIVPADRAFELLFRNDDPGVKHNVEIANGPDLATFYLRGEIIDGVAEITYQVNELPAGDYYFVCIVHPTTMTGTVEARPETAPGGGPPGPPVPGGGAPPSP